jgi:hypothetical protein
VGRGTRLEYTSMSYERRGTVVRGDSVGDSVVMTRSRIKLRCFVVCGCDLMIVQVRLTGVQMGKNMRSQS